MKPFHIRKLALAALLLSNVLGDARASKVDDSTRMSAYWNEVAQSLSDRTDLGRRAARVQYLAMARSENAGGIKATPALQALAGALLSDVAQSEDPVAVSMVIQAGNRLGDKALVQAAVDRWRQLEPTNIAPWLHGDGAVDDLLSKSADMRSNTSHYFANIRMLQSILGPVPMPGGSDAKRQEDVLVMAISVWAAYALPGFRPITQACSSAALQSTSTRRADCQRMGELMANHSDDSLGEAIGISILRRAATTPAEKENAEALHRTFYWQLEKRFLPPADAAALQREAGDMLRLLQDPNIRTERQLNQAILRERGIALTPPPDWSPANTD